MDATRRTPQALIIYEILQYILLALPIRDLLLAQRVCRQWRSLIQESQPIQRALFFVPTTMADPDTNPVSIYQFETNSLLASACAPHFEIPIHREFSGRYVCTPYDEHRRRYCLEWTIDRKDSRYVFRLMLHSDPQKRHESFEYSEASWRRMFLTQPPTTEVELIDDRDPRKYDRDFASYDDGTGRYWYSEVIEYSGIRMGHLPLLEWSHESTEAGIGT
jgi:hypothetical protein